MNNSAFLLGSLIIAFLVWITTKGELRTYLGFFTVASGGTGSPSSGAAPSSESNTSVPGSFQSPGPYPYQPGAGTGGGSNPLFGPIPGYNIPPPSGDIGNQSGNPLLGG